MELLFKVISIKNDDVISTSNLLFNTADIRNTKWFFYNVDTTNADNRNMDVSVYCYEGSENYYGVDRSVYLEYKSLVEDGTTFEKGHVYHYINGQWKKCEDTCGTSGINHSSRIS